MLRRLLSAAAISAVFAGSALAAERAIIVLDASGSMWGQIDGKAKIEIARKTLGQVLGGLPADLELGLIAYGHREKGQCSDIELMVPAGAGTAGAISDAVNSIKPKGKTPLSDAVLQAAEALKYTEDKATVILVTDGLETCDADPCALGRALEESGVDFTAHVVGFGLSKEDGKQVSCLAEATGGVYIPAGNEEELVQALDQTVAQPVEPPAPKASLTAPDTAEIAQWITIGWDGPGEKQDQIQLFDPNSGPNGKVLQRQTVQRGDFENRTVDLPMAPKPGIYQLRYWDSKGREVLATRDIEIVNAEVSLTPDEPITIGTKFGIAWVGPGSRTDEIILFDPNSGPDGKILQRQRLINGDFENQRVTLPAPGTEGTYQLRYWNNDNRAVLATRDIEVQGIPITLTPEEPISVGKSFKTVWDGPGDRLDEIILFNPNKGPDGKIVHRKRVSNDDYDNKTVTLPGPADAGAHELRYYSGSNRKVLATITVDVIEAVVTLTPDDPISVGKAFNVTWEGPGAQYDDIQLFDPNKGPDGKVMQSKRLAHGDYDNRTVTLPGPAKAGPYELRYYSGANRKVLASVTVEVIETPVSLEAADTVEAASKLVVTWEGPGAQYDDVQVWDPSANGGQGKVVTSKRLAHADYDNRKATLAAPAKPGTYELRYWSGQNRVVLATRPVNVIAASVVLIAPDQVGQGMTVKVNWQGPGARYDDVQIWDPRREKVVHSKRLAHGDYDNKLAALPAPAAPGMYELRYWNGENRAVLATKPIEVTEIEVSLEGPEVVEPETLFGVTWTGPGARYDDVEIYDPAKSKVIVRKRLAHGDYDNRKVSIKAPKAPGEYLLRYYNGENKAVLFEQPLSVN